MKDKLLKIFISTECLPENTLKEYIKGGLNSHQRHLVEKHLTDCTICQDVVDGLSFLSDPDKLESIIADLNLKIDKKISGTRIVKYNFKKIMAVAASFLLLLTISLITVKYINNTTGKFYTGEYKNNLKQIENTKKSVENSEDVINTDEQKGDEKVERSASLSPEVINEESGELKDEDKRFDHSEVVRDEDAEEQYLVYEFSNDLAFEDSEEEVSNLVTSKSDNFNTGANYGGVAAEAKSENDQSFASVERNNDRTIRSLINTEKKSKAPEVELEEISGGYKDDIDTAPSIIFAPEYGEINTITLDGRAMYYIDNQINIGIINFENGKYNEALNNFQLVLDQSPGNFTANYYIGLCGYKTGDYTSAIKYFDFVLKNNQSDFYYDAEYYKAMSYIYKGKKKTGMNMLNSIIKNQGPYSEKAAEIMKDIDNQ